jgi:hypothetical protein
MPGFDGTGPLGRGPMSGRAQGFCVLKNSKENPGQLEGFAGLQGVPIIRRSSNSEHIEKEVQQCQYLNTSVKDVATRPNLWKKAAAKASTSAKNVEAHTCRNCFQDSPLDKAGRGLIPSQLERAQPERADFLRKDVS